jgi:ketosteroid isomerase-like protein
VSDDAVTVVRRAFEQFADEGVEALLPLVHEDVVATVSSEFSPEPDSYVGHEGMRRYFEGWYEVMDELDITIEDPESVGEDQVIASVQVVARGRATGIASSLDSEALFHLREGRIDRLSFHATRDAALAEATGGG